MPKLSNADTNNYNRYKTWIVVLHSVMQSALLPILTEVPRE